MEQHDRDLIIWYANLMSKIEVVEYDTTFTSTKDKDLWLLLIPIFLRDLCMEEYINLEYINSTVLLKNGSLETLETLETLEIFIAKELTYPTRLAFIYYMIYLNLMGLDMKKIHNMLQLNHIPLHNITSISSKIAVDYINKQIQWGRNRHVVTVNNTQQKKPNKSFEEVLQLYLEDFCMQTYLPKSSFAIMENMIHENFNRDQKNQFFNLNEYLISLHLMNNDYVSIRQKLENQLLANNDNFPIDHVNALVINEYVSINRVVIYTEERISWERRRPN